jgi:hypothetical protein
MSQQLLIPGMQDSQKAQACPQLSRISSDGEKCLRNGAEEYPIHNGWVLQGKRNEFMRQSEDHM